ncbi:MAG: MbcA/ParS/Xre antitoxin family protein [Rhodospirillales bacterium]
MSSARALPPAKPGVAKPDNAAIVGKAALRAASQLKLTNKVFANVVGLSEATVSRLRAGEYQLQPKQKPFELALLLVRLYRSLDAIVGGDDAVAASWLTNRNTLLGEPPLHLIQTVPGLMNVIQYLDARRAVL